LKILVNLISGQPSPNLIAYKHLKPDRVISLFTHQSEKQNEYLKSLITNSLYESEEVKAFEYYKYSDFDLENAEEKSNPNL